MAIRKKAVVALLAMTLVAGTAKAKKLYGFDTPPRGTDLSLPRWSAAQVCGGIFGIALNQCVKMEQDDLDFLRMTWSDQPPVVQYQYLLPTRGHPYRGYEAVAGCVENMQGLVRLLRPGPTELH